MSGNAESGGPAYRWLGLFVVRREVVLFLSQNPVILIGGHDNSGDEATIRPLSCGKGVKAIGHRGKQCVTLTG